VWVWRKAQASRVFASTFLFGVLFMHSECAARLLRCSLIAHLLCVHSGRRQPANARARDDEDETRPGTGTTGTGRGAE
jgi:hypothetical protein